MTLSPNKDSESSQDSELAAIHAIIDKGKITGLQILVVLAALALNMLDGFDITSMAFTAHSIGEELQIAPDQLGIVFSVALGGMMAGSMYLAPFSDVIGRRKMIMICATTIGTSMLLTGLVNSLWQLFVLRGITGLGVGGLLASLVAITTEYTPEKYRNLAVVCISAGYPLGATLGGFIAAPMIPAYGWEAVFFAGGTATLLMVLVVYLWVPESIQFLLSKGGDSALLDINRILKRLNREQLSELPYVESNTAQTKASVFSLLNAERLKKTLILWFSFIFCYISLYFMMSWIPKLVVLSGMTEKTGVYASVAFNGAALLGILTLGWLSARIWLSNLICIFLAGAAVCMLVFSYFEGIEHLFIYLFVIGFLLQGGFTGLYAVASKLYPTELRSTGVGWAIGMGRTGAIIGPYAGGLLIAGGVSMEINFAIFALPLIVSGCIAYILKVK